MATLRLFKIAIATLILLPWASAEVPAQEALRAAAVVNDEIVSMLDVEQRLLLSILGTGQQDSPKLRQRMLSQVVRGLIDERLQAQEAERLDIAIDEKQLDEAIGEIAGQNNLALDEFLRLLKSRGVLIESLRDQIRAQLTWQALIARRIRPTAQVSDDEIEDAVRRVRASQGTTLRLVSEIFLSVDDPDRDDEVRQNAERIFEQIRAKAEFRLLAREFSESATAMRGGEVGWVQKGQLVDEIDAALETMRPGQISMPIRTLAGYHIVWLRDERQSAQGDVTLELKQILFALPSNPSAAQRDDALARAGDTRAKVTGCPDFETLGASEGSPGSGDLGKVKLAELPPAVREAVRGLSSGQVSQPVALPAGISLLIVCNREDSGIDRARIGDRLAEERLNVRARRFMRDLRRNANVDIRI